MTAETMEVRGYLLHITHYDPSWCKVKDQEKPFDLAVGFEVIDAMAESGLNLLLLDVKDGVVYSSHPELKRPYSQPIDIVHRLRERAESRGLETAIKLNFSQSPLHQHNHWFRPHNDLFDNEEYWKKGFEIVDELIAAFKPKRFFHVGMDEDHSRSYTQYVKAIETLHDGLTQRGLRTVIWNDSACHWPAADIHLEKSLYAEKRIPTDIIQVLWNYWDVEKKAFRRIRKRGVDLWGAPGSDAKQIAQTRKALGDCGAMGMLLTRWRPCIAENRADLLEHIRVNGPTCA